jgi:hypothetical protein
MSKILEQVTTLLTGEIELPDSRIAIVSDRGFSAESSMLGTRDGFLHMALEIISFVARSDKAWQDGTVNNEEHDEFEDLSFWADTVRRALYEFPSIAECTVVGAYLVKDHEALLDLMRKFLPDEVHGWEADTQFKLPKRRK